jgi:dTDP-4-dehydrorhamnose reductase
MTILLIGGSGQLGRELTRRSTEYEQQIVSPVSAELDISNSAQILRLVRNIRPSCIINAAAYTAVDNAEVETEKAHSVNSLGVGYIAEAAREVKARLIHVSTDYVFSGNVEEDLGSIRPYREDDVVNPLSVYGKSKRAGEVACLNSYPEGSLILRTSSLFAGKGPNFVLTMLKLFEREEDLTIVSDQVMSPTWAGWLAHVVLRLVDKPDVGVMHASCGGTVSWFNFAQAIYDIASELYIERGEVPPFRAHLVPISVKFYKRPAPRPMYSVLDCSRLVNSIEEPQMPWRKALTLYLRELIN